MRTYQLLYIGYIIALGASCTGCTNSTKPRDGFSLKDTSSIYNIVLNHDTIQACINDNVDTIRFVKNKFLSAEAFSSIRTTKPAKYIDPPQGYPKNPDIKEYSYYDFYISFETVTLIDNNAKCIILLKSNGIVGTFDLEKRSGKWVIINYEEYRI